MCKKAVSGLCLCFNKGLVIQRSEISVSTQLVAFYFYECLYSIIIYKRIDGFLTEFDVLVNIFQSILICISSVIALREIYSSSINTLFIYNVLWNMSSPLNSRLPTGPYHNPEISADVKNPKLCFEENFYRLLF